MNAPIFQWFSAARIREEVRLRIVVSRYAYAYEFEFVSLVSDHVFDEIARSINPAISTGIPRLDEFFRTEFSPDTGMWIRRHPELDAVAAWYRFIHEDGPLPRRVVR